MVSILADGHCRVVVAIQWWLLAHICLYYKPLIKFSFPHSVPRIVALLTVRTNMCGHAIMGAHANTGTHAHLRWF